MYVGENRGSILDLILEKRVTPGELIKEMHVIERLKSDHLPVSFLLEKGSGRREKDEKKEMDKRTT